MAVATPIPDDEPTVSVLEFARRTGLHRNTVSKYIRNGTIPARKGQRDWEIPLSAVLTVIQQKLQDAMQPAAADAQDAEHFDLAAFSQSLTPEQRAEAERVVAQDPTFIAVTNQVSEVLTLSAQASLEEFRSLSQRAALKFSDRPTDERLAWLNWTLAEYSDWKRITDLISMHGMNPHTKGPAFDAFIEKINAGTSPSPTADLDESEQE